jgi:cell division protein FtsQ
MDPRIRDRRVGVTRARGRRRLHLVLGLVVVTGLVLGGWYLAHSSLLSARVIVVSGAAHTTPQEVIAVAGLADHPPLVDVNPGTVAARIEGLPWVAKATVRRQWPDGVRISLTQRSPDAVIALAAGKVALVDGTGRVLALVASAPPGLVTLTVPGHVGGAGTTLGSAAGPAVRVADTLPAAFRTQVATITVGPDGQVTLGLTSPLHVDLGTATELAAKYEDVAALLSGATLHPGDVIDVTVPDSPTVEGP